MLEIRHITKIFSDANHHVLDDLDFTVKDGEFVCILGPSGCGKTVLLDLIAGFLRPTSGEIYLDGRKLEKPDTDRILMFQESVLFPWKTVYGNIMFGLEKTNLPMDQKEELVDKYLDLVGMKPYQSWYIHKLSGGMKQRISLARAMISDPKVLLMDEPFSALDPQSRKFMRRSLESIWQKTGKTIIFVTHSVNEAIYLADTIYLFSSIPVTIAKKYHVNLPRPRNSRSEIFAALGRNIDNKIQSEFNQEHDFSEEESLKNLLMQL